MMSWFPENISTYGGEIDAVFHLIYVITIGWFVAAELAILWFVIRYRARPGHKASYVRGETWKQLSWLLVPSAIILALDLGIDAVSAPAWAKIKEHAPEGGVYVAGMAKQFNWDFRYPGKDGKLDSDDDFTVENELHVPVNQNVHVAIGSKDVLHSFFIPTVRVKQDVIPGRTTKIWFNATKPGRYELPCAELCGFGHYTMRGFLVVHTPEEYQSWLAERLAPAAN